MPFKADVYRVLIASPSEMKDERKIATDAITDFNDLHASEEHVILISMKWETHARPQSGTRPQAAINEQIVKDCDILVGMFWTKIGTPTGVAESGTIEEIDQFVTSGRPALLYFSKRPIDPDSIVLKQIRRLRKFKENTLKVALVGQFASVDELRVTLHRDLLRQVRHMRKGKPRRGDGSIKDAWRERDQLELYLVACLSLGLEPSLPVDEEPQLSRLRLLKDAIRNGELRATLSPSSPSSPDVWATVNRKDLAQFAKRRRHEQLLKLVERWAGADLVDRAARKNAVRLRLTQLRTEGVGLRNKAFDLTSDKEVDWIAQTESWNEQVQRVIKRSDRADAEWFRTLDVIPPPRVVLPRKVSSTLLHHYSMHDYRLERLDQLIQKYGGPG